MESTTEGATMATTSTPKATTPKSAKPKPLYRVDQIVFATHKRLHPTEGEAKVLRDFFPNSTYVKLAWTDSGEIALVHRTSVSTDPKGEETDSKA
jgi:hypothetical protein